MRNLRRACKILETSEQIPKFLPEDGPVTIHLVSGRQSRVLHTDYGAISMSNTSLVITDDRDNIEIIRLPSIESITFEKPAA